MPTGKEDCRNSFVGLLSLGRDGEEDDMRINWYLVGSYAFVGGGGGNLYSCVLLLLFSFWRVLVDCTLCHRILVRYDDAFFLVKGKNNFLFSCFS